MADKMIGIIRHGTIIKIYDIDHVIYDEAEFDEMMKETNQGVMKR